MNNKPVTHLYTDIGEKENPRAEARGFFKFTRLSKGLSYLVMVPSK